ncbi:hypothetical protein K402DRAFT_364293 [Aulographum hederae CBS 113979]|uniref:Pex N-terminal domain-containing protein n=1 Tax=Aulographum hederae CBS 113979 TaxID=1176131 RepID=A0A6G1GLH1_9PEZI|nr:hypothetical protein K402DRAFT_364293 [Aulographum hederae CBS 113979]
MPSADFAQAQARLLARRQQRQDALQARIEAQQSSRSATLGRLPFPLNSLNNTSLLVWDSIKGRSGTRPAFRVGQVDAELLDEELLELLKAQAGEGLKYFGTHLSDEYSAEILLVLRVILFKLSIWDHDASYGASLQGLRYTDARDKSLSRPPPKPWQKAVYGFVTVGGRYAWTKWEDYLITQEGGYEEPSPTISYLSHLTNRLSTVHSLVSLASFLTFLTNGHYRTILDRLLRLRLAPTSAHTSREVSFEYLNRQLVWHAFTEFLLFLLPLVGVSRWRRILGRLWRRTKRTVTSAFGGRATSDDDDEKAGGELAFLPERTCAICYHDQNPSGGSEAEMLAASATSGVIGSAQTDVTNPYEAVPCGCIYCFVCLAQRIEVEEGEGWTCLRCGEVVKECKPWDGDVVIETETHAKRPGSGGKSVGFADDHSEIEHNTTTDTDTDGEGKRFGGLKEMDPLPEVDEEEKRLSQTIEGLADSDAARELDESGEWARASRMVEGQTPSASVTETETEEDEGEADDGYGYDEDESGYGGSGMVSRDESDED